MVKIIALDPGIKKCGLLLADTNEGIVIEAINVEKTYVLDLINLWCQGNIIKQIVLGDGTGSNYWQGKLNQNNDLSLQIVNEKNTTLRARYRFWEIWPPNNFLRFMPRSLLFPPGKLDAIAALIILEDYLNMKFIWPKGIPLRTWPE